MYSTLYNLIINGVFDGSVTVFQDEVCQVLATLGSLSVVIAPFLLVVGLAKWLVDLVR